MTEINVNQIMSRTMTACCSDKLNCSLSDLFHNKIKVFLTKLKTKSKLDFSTVELDLIE